MMTVDVRIDPADRGDLDALAVFLAAQHLPPDGLGEHLATTLVARRAGRIVGSAAVEVYPDGALLRSVAVSPELRGTGMGQALTDAAIGLARERGAAAIYLLTTTAERFFPRFGFEGIDRSEVPAGVRTSVEFTTACPASATVMRLGPKHPSVAPGLGTGRGGQQSDSDYT